MKKQRISIILLFTLIIILLTSCIIEENQIVEDKMEDDEEDEISKQISKMSLDEKIGQLMIIGYEGKEFNEKLDSKLKDLKPAGIIMFEKNVDLYEKTVDEINTIKKKNKIYENIPLFISVDEEGGTVSRLPKDMVKTLDAKTIGKIKDEDIIRNMGSRIGKNIKSLGYNMNFAPVLDIKTNPNNKAIGTRSYGKDIETVLISGINIMNGLRDEGIISVVKHFPGHGDTEVDSHYSLPKVRKSLEELEKFEIKPFMKAIDENVDGIMIGHIAFPHIDKHPASNSKVIIHDLLREKYKFKGVIISDDLTMGAITNSNEPDTAGVNFIEAGGDIALLAHGEDIGYSFRDKLKDAIEKGEISEESIDCKVYRILSLKEKYSIDDEIVDYENLSNINKKTEKMNLDILECKEKQQYIEEERKKENE